MKILPDTSVIINGILRRELENVRNATVLIHEAVLSELEFQTVHGRASGFRGFEELEKIRKMGVKIKHVGRRPTAEDVKNTGVDEILRRFARRSGAVLMTSDYVQAMIAELKGIRVKYFPAEWERLKISEIIPKDAFSVRFRDGDRMRITWYDGRQEEIGERVKREEMREFEREICEFARCECERRGFGVYVTEDARFMLVKPPLSGRTEIFAFPFPSPQEISAEIVDCISKSKLSLICGSVVAFKVIVSICEELRRMGYDVVCSGKFPVPTLPPSFPWYSSEDMEIFCAISRADFVVTDLSSQDVRSLLERGMRVIAVTDRAAEEIMIEGVHGKVVDVREMKILDLICGKIQPPETGGISASSSPSST